MTINQDDKLTLHEAYKLANTRAVNVLVKELEYLCKEAVDHEYGFKEFREALLKRIETEGEFFELFKPGHFK